MNTEKIKNLFRNKVFRAVAVGILAFLLLFAIWKVFFPDEEKAGAQYQPTALEERLSLLLGEIDGIEEATVMIGEEDGTAVSAVVIIKGDTGLVARARVIDATANLLHIARQEILVYPA